MLYARYRASLFKSPINTIKKWSGIIAIDLQCNFTPFAFSIKKAVVMILRIFK